MATAFWILLYAIMAGSCLALFTLIPSMLRFVFSLLVLYIILRFFRRFERVGHRIIFVVLLIVIFYSVVLVTRAVQYIYFPEMLDESLFQ